MKYSIKYLLFSGLFALFVFPVHADEDGKNMFNPLTTGVTTLGIAPDARGGSMGDLGVAPTPMSIRSTGIRRNMHLHTAVQEYRFLILRGCENWSMTSIWLMWPDIGSSEGMICRH